MREILFRAWDSEISELIYDLDKIDFNLGYAFYTDGKEEIQSIIIKDLEQFTGMVDKNGVKIFEGDIIDEMTSVFWCKECCSFAAKVHGVNKDGSDYCLSCNGDWSWSDIVVGFRDECTLTVIGNIHENKELISN